MLYNLTYMEKEIFDKIESLVFEKSDFIVIGSAVMQIKGLRKSGDIDLLVRKGLFLKLKEDKNWSAEVMTLKGGQKRECLYFDVFQVRKDFWIDIKNETLSEDFDYFKNSNLLDVINGFNFIKLELLLRAKSALLREKDLNDIKLISEYLNKTK